MKSKQEAVVPIKGQAPLCNQCANQFLHTEGHDEPCSVHLMAQLSDPLGLGVTGLDCTHYINRITTKEEVHKMSEQQNPAIKQPSIQVALAGPASVDLKFHYSPEDGKSRHSLNLSIPVSESDLDQVRFLTKQSGTWFVTLGVEGVQTSMDEALAKQSDEPMNLDAGQESRIEEAVGQKG